MAAVTPRLWNGRWQAHPGKAGPPVDISVGSERIS
jgi:hypothetical protein